MALSEAFQRTKEFELVASVTDLAAVLDVVSQKPCDLAILDLNMPGMNGLSGVAKLQAQSPGLKIALISGDIDDRIIAAGRKAGIVGFLLKAFEPSVIIAAVKLMLTGETYVPYDVKVAAKADNSGPSSAAAGPTDLTARELEILLRMARGASHK